MLVENKISCKKDRDKTCFVLIFFMIKKACHYIKKIQQ